MTKIIITVASSNQKRADEVVALLKNNPYPDSSDSLQILSDYETPVSNACLSYEFDNDISLKYHIDGSDHIKELQALMHFASAYTEFTKNLMIENEDLDEDSGSFSFEFFSSKTPASSAYPNNKFDDNFQNSKKAQYYFMAGLGLCATSGILFIFAPSFLAITALIVAIAAIGMAFYYHKNQDVTADFLPCSM